MGWEDLLSHELVVVKKSVVLGGGGGGHVMLKVQALFGTILDFHRVHSGGRGL